MESCALHIRPELMEACADLINEEWPRSRTARMLNLEKSNAKLPYSLVLLDPEEGVVGHGRICRVQRQPDACYVESVVVKKSHRGRGLGRKLMQETEKHAKQLGISVIYLNTKDKQDFYQHIGYEYCEPIITLGANSHLLSEEQFERLFGSIQVTPTSKSPEVTKNNSSHGSDEGCNQVYNGPSAGETGGKSPDQTTQSPEATTPVILLPPAPPAPPPPPIAPPAGGKQRYTHLQKAATCWLKKKI